MIRRLRISDTDQFVDILNNAFGRELHHIGGQYRVTKRRMKIQYLGIRLLQKLFGDIRNLQDIFAYYDGSTVLGITQMVLMNARGDHWYTEMTAVRENLQKKGVGTALKQFTVNHYMGRARRFFGNLREENVASLKANTRAGYIPYVRNILFKKEPSSRRENREIEGFRRFKGDEKGVFDLYMKTTPPEIVELEDKTPEDFSLGIMMKLLGLLHVFTGEHDRRYVIERDGIICAYFSFEQLWLTYENLEFMVDPASGISKEAVNDVISTVSPSSHIVCYVPEYREPEKQSLIDAGFEVEEPYLKIVRVFEVDEQ
ncbi:MAG: GNAT family N-acetyltransferase [Theionarchaea archaeon]|nr:GNAT family N-acetyltransferase [Theionarchaea archaeon]MBU7001011.1 GNAT family N-acetyltransferase [Theionarchaea archaeon]MBU7020500.1 GNAT family N-acetyltransferase [Theionarchaea archaeon]MBU7034457.1 GNAT family N-acetyltransferase [Theionarchaea archaeon]MBU7039794.1 GNAT family N-acetyltransferase [Theionarchaea archaeon]